MCNFNLNQFTYFEPNLSIIIREWSFLKMILFVWDADSKFLMQMGLCNGGLFLKLNVWFWDEGLMIFSNHSQYFLRIFLISLVSSSPSVLPPQQRLITSPTSGSETFGKLVPDRLHYPAADQQNFMDIFLCFSRFYHN